MPVLEAMARGVPVACSDNSSLPEVSGEAALYFDPHEQSQIAAQIARLLADEQLARTLVERGRRRCELFTWRRRQSCDARQLPACAGAGRRDSA